MVCFLTSIAVDQYHINMAKSANSVVNCVKPKQFDKNKRVLTSPNLLAIPACEKSATAIIDVLLLFAVITAFGFLLFPYAKILAYKTTEFTKEVIDILVDEIVGAPMVFGCLGLSILFAVTALFVIVLYTDTRCGKSGCLGLRKSPEFDIQFERDDSCKKQNTVSKNQKGILELRREHHPELEAELKKMAPINGKVVLIYRAKCGCSIGRMEVPGPRKFGKAKK